MNRTDRTEILRAMGQYLPAGRITEIRALDATAPGERYPQTFSGYFDDPQALADAVAKLTSARAVYFVPNEIDRSLLARAANRLRPVKKEPTTADADVLRRRWLLIDCDPCRASGISATDAEHAAAIALAECIRDDLTLEGWHPPILADSGNGSHCTYPIDLPADDGGLIERCLKALAAKYDTAAVHVDTGVFNPARIWKLPGTLACKGDNTTDRPHRMARLLHVPDKLTPIPQFMLEQLAEQGLREQAPAQDNRTHHANGRVCVEAWIRQHNLNVHEREAYKGGHRWRFKACPWNESHTDGSAFLLRLSSGAIAAGCHHNGCAGKDWHALRDLVEPGWRNQPAGSNGTGHAQARPGSIPPARPTQSAWREFPITALPAVMERFARELAGSLCVDASMAALPMLSIAGAAIGNTARARMSADYHTPPNVWTAPVVRSGERKSPILRAVMAPIYVRQHEAAEQHAQAVAEYQQAMERWKAKPKGDRGDSPMEPGPYPHLYLADTTTEAIAMRLSAQPRGLAVVLDELAAFFGAMNQYKAGKGNDRESYLAFYDAGPAKIDRRSSTPPTIFIPRAFVTVTGMIQPGALARVLGPAEFDSGMAARFLFASPPPRQATWSEAGMPDDARDAWRDLLHGLLDMPLPEQPALIPPSDDAMRTWCAAHDRMEAERFAEPDDRVRAARAKLIGMIPRLALIFQCASAASGEKNATVRYIDATSMNRAVELVEWAAYETRRVYGLLADDGGSDDDILARIQANGGTVSVRELMRWSRSEFRSAHLAEGFLDSLVHEAAGRWVWMPQRGGGRPRRVFLLLDTGDGDTTHASNANNAGIVTVTSVKESGTR